jgi:hypothetical protein
MLAGGEYEATKWYTLGRNSKELVYVMPDNKTVYITDDGTNVALFKFVMDTPKDLSSGTMYGAKMTQTSDENGGTFDIEWIELGSSTQEELKELLDSGITFADIFETAYPSEDSTCPEGFKSVNTGDVLIECLKLKVCMGGILVSSWRLSGAPRQRLPGWSPPCPLHSPTPPRRLPSVCRSTRYGKNCLTDGAPDRSTVYSGSMDPWSGDMLTPVRDG